MQNSERGKKIGNAMMTTSRSVVQTGKVVGKDATLENPDQQAHHRCSSRSVCGRSFDQRQVGHVLLVLHAGSASSRAHAGRAPRRGQTLRPRRPTRLQLGARVCLDEHPGPGEEGSFSTGHRSSRTISDQLILTAGDTKDKQLTLMFVFLFDPSWWRHQLPVTGATV